MSWITIDDLVRIITFAMEIETVSGILNAVAPEPVTNDRFTRSLAEVLHRPAFLPVPVFVLRVLFGEFAEEAMAVSERIVPAKLSELGFQFEHRNLTTALQSILQK